MLEFAACLIDPFAASPTEAVSKNSFTEVEAVPGQKTDPKRSALRELTIVGEKAMVRAQEEGRMLLSEYPNEVVRSYAASGLLLAALGELQTGLARDTAAETLREALAELGGMPS